MEFEFDPEKSARNKLKHGIDFLQAQELWEDADRVEVPARTVGEPRWLVVARVDGVHWSAVVTYRGTRVRIISVRRSRSEEVKIYEEDEH
ncbi:BrnT family toxin [Aciditerrimonas ferrireducens]|uniref:BrnT family toxin n=1 Tax=Aciditerrimonas ferrireducens TaxID=667306 RepID=A0ABV6C4N7_9ACTN